MTKHRINARRVCIFLLSLTAILFLWGCSAKKTEVKKISDLDFTVLDDSDIPEELQTMIEERKAEGFKLTYSMDGYLYIAQGYGEQDTGGYSVQVEELYLTDNAVYFKSQLLGPEKGSPAAAAVSYPQVVVKLEERQKNVVFQ